MNSRLVETIMRDFGKFLELSHGALSLFFLSEIPETLLPYSKEKIEEALKIALKHYVSVGDKEASEHIKVCVSALLFYTDDHIAIKAAISRIKDKGRSEKLIEARRKRQNKLFKELEVKIG